MSRPSPGTKRRSPSSNRSSNPTDRPGSRGRLRQLDDVGPDRAEEILLGRAMLDQTNHLIGPALGIFDRDIVAVSVQKLNHRDKRSPLVTLFEGVSLRDARHEPDCENKNGLFTAD